MNSTSLKKIKRGDDFELEVMLEEIGDGTNKYFRVMIEANVLGTDDNFDGRRHKWMFSAVKVLSTGIYFYGQGDDIRLYKDVYSKHAKEMMKKLSEKLSSQIGPHHKNMIYHDHLIHNMCIEIQKQLVVMSVLGI